MTPAAAASGPAAPAAAGRARGKPRGWRWPWPQSLAGHVTAVVLLVGAAALLVQVVVWMVWIRWFVQQHSGAAISQLRAAQAVLRGAPADERDALAAAMQTPWLSLSREPLPYDDRSPLGGEFSEPPYFDELRSALGPAARLHAAPGRDSLIFEVPVDREIWWARYAALPPTRAMAWTLVGWALLAAGVLAAGRMLALRSIARPIAALSAQIHERRARLEPILLPPRASTELRDLAASFNGLAETVAQANASKQQLLAGVSHDLRTPLARLRLRIETQCDPAVSLELGRDVLTLERIVGQFLAYVEGDVVPHMGPAVALDRTVLRVADSFARSGEPVVCRIEAVGLRLPEVAVERIVANLVDNALEHGRGRVSVLVQATGQGHRLVVRDQGPGMTPEEFERARAPFCRLDPARSAGGHCGLGLAIVASLAARLDATVELCERDDDAGGFGIAVVWRGPIISRPTEPASANVAA